MLRSVRFLVVLAGLVGIAIWLADNPGSISVNWLGYRIDASFAVLVVAVALVAILVALLYRLWLFVRRAPGHISRAGKERRRRRGYLALTRGMVAVAAGDADEAQRQGKRADGLLSDPPLTMLLSAQAAQLAGDEKAAERFFTAMLDRPETEFLGVRGLLTQAMKRGGDSEPLRLAEQAYRLKPKSAWVAANLFDQQTRAGRWAEARKTLEQSIKNKLVPADEGQRRRAVLTYQMGEAAVGAGDGDQARKLLHKAHDLEPDFVPAATRLAALLVAAGRQRKAAAMVEAAWGRNPHPGLVEAYFGARPSDDPLEKVRTVQRLAKLNPDHMESHIAVAAAALEAKLWGEARKHLEGLAADEPSARVCRLMAELEEAEHGDLAAARKWLMRASMADPDPAWVCGHCGDVVALWEALCGKCRSFDSFVWRSPPAVVSLAAPGPVAPAALPAADAGEAVDGHPPPQ
jgi:HemY protein